PRRAASHDDVDLRSHQFSCESGQPIDVSFGPAVLDDIVPTLDISEVMEPPDEGIARGSGGGASWGSVTQIADPPNSPTLLRLGTKRRGEQATSHTTDEGAPVHHSITWSAWRSSDGGIVKPSTFAVFRLMTSSKVDVCSIGWSPGFAPFRILSTYTAALRN